MQNFVIRGLLLALVVAALTGRAAAAESAVASTVVDFSPLVTVVIQILAAIVLAVGTAALGMLTAWLQRRAKAAGLEIDDSRRAVVDQGLQKALGAAVAKVQGAADELARDGAFSADVKSKVIAEASVYALAHIPETLKAFGVTVDSIGKLGDMIEARLGMLAVSQATAPATLATATATEPPAHPAGSS